MRTPIDDELDVLVVGAGFAGIYQLDRLRELGHRVKIYEAGSGLGGVWHHNRYPGARTDSAAWLYQFSREDIWRDWNWTESYPSRQELCRYFCHVDEKLDLSKDIRFSTRVSGAEFDEDGRCWIVRATNELTGEPLLARAQYLVLCLGFAAKSYIPNISGLETFAGDSVHTAHWPENGIEFVDRRVGVIGTGASGVQVIQEFAPEVSQLTVFQRTPNMALPMRLRSLDEQANRELKKSYPERFAMRRNTFAGNDFDFQEKGALELDEKERASTFEKLWQEGGFKPWLGGFLDVFFSAEANMMAYTFWRDRVQARVNDPAVAEKLAPLEPVHPFGVKRCSLEQNYYELYNQDNVELIDLRETQIDRVTPSGVRTTDGREHELDMLVLATGFDALTGGLTAIDIRSTQGESFASVFANGSQTALGKATPGFPNLLYMYGPQSPSAFCNGPSCAELEGEWLVQFVQYMREHGLTRFEATPESQREWARHVVELTEPTLFPLAKSWYMGANIPGKKTELLAYPGGLPMYLEKCNEAAEKGYAGFSLT